MGASLARLNGSYFRFDQLAAADRMSGSKRNTSQFDLLGASIMGASQRSNMGADLAKTEIESKLCIDPTFLASV